ncbi:NAD(P)H-dependent oxidoreductase [Sphingobium aromaticiconvertens]|uniref:NAD(P)H-dependent oxidoreductase n=1 Tax=Sphingobium aromaticiconvertens TaxID=365341 RepID=UPI003017F593
MGSPLPVHHLVVLSHPQPDSFCGAIARCWQERAQHHHQSCDLRDLYRENFDPVLRANEQPGKEGYTPLPQNIAERERLEQLDVLTFVYPVWFGTPPAMLKGYLERVVGSGIGFGPEADDPKPLANVRLVQISTSSSSTPWLNEKGVPSALHTLFDTYIAEVFGAHATYRLHLDAITQNMGEQRAAARLREVQDFADRVCAEANADRWDRVRAKSES